jgi:hypothetical protein
MLIHIVCWKYRTEIDANSRSEHREKLVALKKVIPEILSLQIGTDILHLDRSFDTGLVATFADKAALDVYTEHPDHQAVAALGRTITEQVVSVDFLNE